MLVLSRKFGEAIKIGDNITITVVTLDSGKVRLGIDAPPDVSVHRQEIFDCIGANRTVPAGVRAERGSA